MSQSPSLLRRMLRPFMTNDVEAGHSRWYPDLEPRAYQAGPKAVFETAQTVVADHPRWTLIEADGADLRLDVEVRTKRMGWVDDMTIRIESGPAGRATVGARSASRVGSADFGQNARTIRALFDRLSRRLS